MHRFYTERVNGDTAFISDAGQLHHLKDVLRLKAGDEVVLFDLQGNEYTGSIQELRAGQALLTVKGRKRATVPKTGITVAGAIPKQAKMDEIIDSLTQLGVDRVIPMLTERVVVRLDESRKVARLERWRRIAESVAEQSRRNTVPLISPITSIESVISHSEDFDLKLIPTLPFREDAQGGRGERKSLREVLTGLLPRQVLVLIGPEGDFTPNEVEMAMSAGFIPVSLGDTVLRVSTAAIAVVSYIRLALMD